MKLTILRLVNTIRYLKWSQIFNQIRVRTKKLAYIRDSQPRNFEIGGITFVYEKLCRSNSLSANSVFTFLNKQKNFSNTIDWNFLEYGKLWSYNLEYFDYLHQEDIKDSECKFLIEDFYQFSVEKKRVLEPYPVSLRAINIIKYAIKNNLLSEGYLGYVHQELSFLHKNYEFHLLGNHLLENAFALCMGGAFFKNKDWHNKSVEILFKELEEQIMNDGAHFELSPMYHSIIFYRVLELIDWYSSYEGRRDDFFSFLLEKARRMRAWLEQIQFENGDLPLFNDAANKIAYETDILLSYADKLQISSAEIPLGISGYRVYKGANYEIKVDFAQIGASYQPGHAHADALSFILYYNGCPLFVEQGTSTYEAGFRRELERSTEAHNTVVVNNINQSQVWGGFRVGQRAKTTIIKDELRTIEAEHDGYEHLGVVHRRTYNFDLCTLHIRDVLDGETYSAKAIFHIHPKHSVILIDNTLKINDEIICDFKNCEEIILETFDYAESYNKYQKGQRAIVTFRNSLETLIKFIY